MKRKLNMDEFESFIADSADEVRMYPSDRVWRNIDKELHGEKQWPALTFGAVLTTALMLATLIFLHPDKDLFEFEPLAKAVPPTKTAVVKPLLPHSDFEHNANKTLQPSPFAHHAAAEASVNVEPATNGPAEQEDNLSGNLFDLNGNLAGSDFFNLAMYAGKEVAVEAPHSLVTPVLEASEQKAIAEAMPPEVASHLNETTALNEMAPGLSSATFSSNEKAAAENSLGSSAAAKQTKSQRWGIQYYLTPSSSYRILTEEKYYDKNLFPGGQIPASYYNDVRRVVNQDAGFGAEAGAAFTYSVTDRLTLKAGLQFNLRRYNINAYRADISQASAIRLQQAGAFDTLMAASNIINYASDRPTQIHNQHIQLSLPVGFELAMARFGKSSFIIATTIQPTYNISQQSWMITSDYQRYVQQQKLNRNFNLNAGFEAFFRFRTKGNLSWQIGPQIRYQLLSSFADQYPVKENLIDYGFKIGLSKTLH